PEAEAPERAEVAAPLPPSDIPRLPEIAADAPAPLPAPLPQVRDPAATGTLATDSAPEGAGTLPAQIAGGDVVVRRLPQIGAPAAVAPLGESGADAAVDDALTRNGEPFENPEGKPLVAVVLLDGGGPLIELPLPVSIAVDPTLPDAAARAEAYRAQGKEVLVIPTLPEGATATDTAVALESNLATVPVAAALIDRPDGELQTNRDAMAEVVSELSRTGHGLVSFPSGLNAGQQVAGRAGVPAALVFRQIDAEGQDLRAVKRFLDQAAFRARQEEAVILVGRNRPETLGALLEWTLGNRAATVTLAPVSAALKALSGT
ncbi:divergent polysaccharide deacetylase family protein, partial [Oceaniglobus roseus]|uniref:divergent polysaccharide deacetylase family protein n=1 Tax=Oceaniglobus roseus TaxID=1737570 RepID=UPI0015627BB9